jgi:hypothetical protein
VIAVAIVAIFVVSAVVSVVVGRAIDDHRDWWEDQP